VLPALVIVTAVVVPLPQSHHCTVVVAAVASFHHIIILALSFIGVAITIVAMPFLSHHRCGFVVAEVALWLVVIDSMSPSFLSHCHCTDAIPSSLPRRHYCVLAVYGLCLPLLLQPCLLCIKIGSHTEVLLLLPVFLHHDDALLHRGKHHLYDCFLPWPSPPLNGTRFTVAVRKVRR